MPLDQIPHNFMTARLEDVVRWGRRNSVFPATFGLACCALEMMATGAAHYDLARFGMETFRASPCVAELPSTPVPPIEVDRRPDRPQPRLDLDRGGGMGVTVGRVRPCPILDLRMVVLGHNTVRGAAGQAVQIAELLVADGRVAREG